jgi:hypothetical protein
MGCFFQYLITLSDTPTFPAKSTTFSQGLSRKISTAFSILAILNFFMSVNVAKQYYQDNIG